MQCLEIHEKELVPIWENSDQMSWLKVECDPCMVVPLVSSDVKLVIFGSHEHLRV